MPSTRRRFLLSAALAASLAGCSGGESPESHDTTAEMTRVETTATTPRAAETTATGGTTTTYEPRKETPESDAVRWRVSFDDAIGTPVVGAKRVFVPVGEPHYGTGEESVGALAGLDADDGTLQWTNRLPAAPTGRPHFGDGGVYCTTGTSDGLGLHGRDQRCLGFDPDGTERWRTDPVNQFLNVLAFGDDRAYLATSDDALGWEGQRLFAVDLTSGRTAWSVESGDASRSRFLDGTVAVDIGGRGVAVHDAASGDRRWAERSQPLAAQGESFPVADGALLVRRSKPNRRSLAALDAADGSVRWRYRPDGTELFSPTAAGVVGDAVVGLTYDGLAFALDAADGTERWTFDAGGDAESFVGGDGLVFFAGRSDDGRDTLFALDAGSGTERWRLGRAGVRPVEATDGTLVATSDGRNRGFVAALDPEDGTERWSFEANESLSRPVVADGRVYVVGETGIVRALGE